MTLLRQSKIKSRPVLLTLSLLVLLYLLFLTWSFHHRGTFEYIGLDYRVYYATGQIAREYGFSRVYDQELQERFQRPLYEKYSLGPGPVSMPFVVTPTPYLPVFLVPFLLPTFLRPIPGYFLWVLLNAALVVLYARRLRKAFGFEGRSGILPELLLSLPVFTNLMFGQISGWLLVFLGEHLLAGVRKQDFKSGFWLAGLLMKPQTLIIFLPGIMIRRRYSTLAGFAAGASAIGAFSLFLAGSEGIRSFLELVFAMRGEYHLNFPSSMMNWRAAALNLSPVVSPAAAWGLAAGGMAVTFAAGLWIWFRRFSLSPLGYALVVLGTYSATCALTWHSHIHMSLPLLAVFIILHGEKALSSATLHLWVLLPPAVFFAAAFSLGVGSAHNLVGAAFFLLNLYLLARTLLYRPNGHV